MKRFKRQSDLIKQSCKCTTHHQDVEIPARMEVAEGLTRTPTDFVDGRMLDKYGGPDFLQQCAAKLRRVR